MRLAIDGLETVIEFVPGHTSVLQIENSALFARVARSFDSLEGRFALEPYTFWTEDREEKPSAALMVIPDPLHLPWEDRSLMGEVLKRIEREFLEDEDLRRAVEKLDSSLAGRLMELGFGLNSDYGFGLEWDLKRYLKFRGFGVGESSDISFLDNLINFLSLALDAGCNKVIAFVNLKTFLTKNDIERLYEYVFYSKLNVVLLENAPDETIYEYERKTIVDLQFLEHQSTVLSDRPSFSQ